jgi:DNA-binding Lrp family transcriptional regulator
MDRTDGRLLLALVDDPRATVMSLAQKLSLSRNTVQARLARYWDNGVLDSFERCINPRGIGYPLTAFILITVVQRRLDEVAANLELVPEMLELVGVSGSIDMLGRVVATDAEDLYRIAGRILAIEGVERTETALVMRQMIGYRVVPLLQLGQPASRPAGSRPTRSS